MDGSCDDGVVLPDDLIVQILSWVPVKFLMRFRCVSKSWNSLVVDSNFVKLHLERSRRDTQILSKVDDANSLRIFLHHCSLERLLDDPLSTFDDAAGLEFGDSYNVVGVCNGLVCLAGRSCVRREDPVQFWNPATRLRSEVFAYEYPGFNYVHLGFGYDDSCDTYKVVLFALNGKSREMELKVYSLGDNSGRKAVVCSAFPYQAEGEGQFLSGTLNWPLRLSTTREFRIFSFDLRNETYRYLSTPDEFEIDAHGFPRIKVLRDSLCVCYSHDNNPFVIWQMKEFGVQKSWTLLVSVRLEHLSLHPYDNPCCMVTNSDVILFSTDYDGAPKIVFYNQRDNKVDCIETPDKIVQWVSSDYVESLVLPYRI